MAHVSKELTSKVREDLKNRFPEFKFSVRKDAHCSTLYVTLLSGPVDFTEFAVDGFSRRYTGEDNEMTIKEGMKREFEKYGYISVNHYWLESSFAGRGLEILEEIKTIANEGNHDRSDIQSDYFDVGWYFNLSIGAFGKPYVVKQ